MSRTRSEWVAHEKGEEYKHHVTMIEFARTLGLEESRFKRWVKSGRIPAPDAYTSSGWRLWSPQQVTDAIRKRAGG
jgi:hypothetical protein